MVLPVGRGALESITTEIRHLTDDPEFAAQHDAWAASRLDFLGRLHSEGPPAGAPGWQRDYFQGKSPGGARASEHQRKLRLLPFDDLTAPAPSD